MGRIYKVTQLQEFVIESILTDWYCLKVARHLEVEQERK